MGLVEQTYSRDKNDCRISPAGEQDTIGVDSQLIRVPDLCASPVASRAGRGPAASVAHEVRAPGQ